MRAESLENTISVDLSPSNAHDPTPPDNPGGSSQNTSNVHVTMANQTLQPAHVSPPATHSRPPPGLDLLATGQPKPSTDLGNNHREYSHTRQEHTGEPSPFASAAAAAAAPLPADTDDNVGHNGSHNGSHNGNHNGRLPEPSPFVVPEPSSYEAPRTNYYETAEDLEQQRRLDKKEKEQLLFRLYALRKKGVHASKRYTIESNLDDMRDEYRILKHNVDMQANRAFSAKMLVMLVTAVEFMNERWDPFEMRLDGWSESVHENITDYDEVFDQLYDKYKEKVSVAPEIKIMMMLGGSAFMFHMTNSMFRGTSVPGSSTLPTDAVQKMMRAAQQEVAPSVPVTTTPTTHTAARPTSPPSRNKPDDVDLPQTETVSDILNYIANEPKATSSRLNNDDARSESTTISIVTTGGTRRKKRQKRVMSLDL